MDTNDIMARLTAVFQDVFEDDEIVLTPEFSADDYDPWDSLNHITLIMQVEKSFGLKFTNAELAGLRNVGDLADLISGKAS